MKPGAKKPASKKGILAAVVILLFSCCICGVVGSFLDNDELTGEPESTRSGSARASRGKAQDKPIPEGGVSLEWIGKRLVSESDLPGGCDRWLEMVDLPGYRSWECDGFDGAGVVSAVFRDDVVLAVLIVSPTEAHIDIFDGCEKETSEEGPAGSFRATCGNIAGFYDSEQSDGLSIVFGSTDDLKRMFKGDFSDVIQFGDRFKLGEYAYKIEFPSRVRSVGKFSPTVAQDGAVFIVIKYQVENLGNETSRALSGDFQLRDRQGRVFDVSSDLALELAVEHDTDFMISELQPGLPRKAVVGFQVPESSLAGPLILIVPEKGLFSRKSVEIPFTLYEKR